ILGNKRALMNVQVPGKTAQPLILAEGQREGEIEVLEIDEKAGIVKLHQSGQAVSLNFEKNGAKLPAAAPVPPPPAPGQLTPVAAAAAGQQPPVPYVPGSPPPVSAGLKTIPTRQVRLPQAGGPSIPGVAPGSGNFQRGSGPPQPPVPNN